MSELAFQRPEDPAIRDQAIKIFETVEAMVATTPGILVTVGRHGDAFACISMDYDPDEVIEQAYMCVIVRDGTRFVRFTP